MQGVLAHELGHIMGGHVIRFARAGKATKISLLSRWPASPPPRRAGEAAMGVMALGQQAANGSLLAFTRVQESSADAASVQYLSKAPGSPAGARWSSSASCRTSNFATATANEDAEFAHPPALRQPHRAAGGRFQGRSGLERRRPIRSQRESRRRGSGRGGSARRTLPADQGQAVRLSGQAGRTLRTYPTYMNTGPGPLCPRLCLSQGSGWTSLREADALIASEPDNPYFLELKGQVLLESGQPEEALEPLRKATQLTNNDPLIASMFGHALIATEDPAFRRGRAGAARRGGRDRENPFAWYQLGIVYGARATSPARALPGPNSRS